MPPPLHRSSNCDVCDCSSEIEPVSLHTAAAYHLEPPEPAPATPIRVDNSHSEKTVWRRPPVVSQTVFASVHVYRRKTHARTGARDFSTCIRDRMQRQIGACRAHQTPPRRIWASAGSMSSSPSRWSLTFANGTTTFNFRVGIGYVDLKLTGARTRDNSDSERTPVPAAKSRPPSMRRRRPRRQQTNLTFAQFARLVCKHYPFLIKLDAEPHHRPSTR